MLNRSRHVTQNLSAHLVSGFLSLLVAQAVFLLAAPAPARAADDDAYDRRAYHVEMNYTQMMARMEKRRSGAEARKLALEAHRRQQWTEIQGGQESAATVLRDKAAKRREEGSRIIMAAQDNGFKKRDGRKAILNSQHEQLRARLEAARLNRQDEKLNQAMFFQDLMARTGQPVAVKTPPAPAQ